MHHAVTSLVLATAMLFSATLAASAQTLERVRDRGFVQCGVTEGTPGFSARNAENIWTGLDVDFCRAVASAIFNDPTSVRFTPLTAQERFDALVAGEIDILARTTTWTMSRDTALGIDFVGVLYYDGQGFMVREDSEVASAYGLTDSRVCMEEGTTSQLNAVDFFAANDIEPEIQTFVNQDAVFAAYEDGRCDAVTSDLSALAAERSNLQNPEDHRILPDVISKEPLAPAVRQGDAQWFNINRWVYHTMIEAEELGVTRDNVDQMLGSDNPAVRRLLGVEGDFGEPLGLTNDWGYRIIRHIGNYGEVFARHIGPATSIGLERGLNALWTDGGIQYAMPIR
ncbi:amino acid ABC transporter substrate-binding protein [Devosia pacifica]|uniref:Amino acid ABC transporter substrate-binding protein n=1 Tax=Devosia pacifica TaxID=1335967 RepID=A0A918RRI6_9HYPH|nr:amino acid ABC transporter substrate-binding protein [Devosia pacifica]GHA10345.1 amino acid ABC transporter substrate-binding protein [Devosia pacifica]